MDEKTEEKIHIEGMDAYEADKDLDACPYRKNSEKAGIWRHGWYTALELESMED